MQFTVNITQEIIDSTKRIFSKEKPIAIETFIDDCPFEKACNNQTPYGASISNTGLIIIWGPYDKPIYYQITYNRALDFIKRWRSNKSVKPFDFTFNI